MSGRYIPKSLRAHLTELAQGRCEYCKSPMINAIHPFNIDHIVPIEQKGATKLVNLALSCGGCNVFKGTKVSAIDPITSTDVPLFHPRQMVWEQHFTWSEDLRLIIGLTPQGRATVDALKLNRQGCVNLRRLMLLSGEHPPS
jgi:hypothetical protein